MPEYTQEAHDLVVESNKLVKELRAKQEDMEKGKITAAEFKEFEEKLNKRFDQVDDRKAEIEKHNKALEEVSSRLDEMETRMNRPGMSGENKEGAASAEYKKTLLKWMRKGAEALSPDEKKTLIISDMIQGGYLAATEMVNEIIKGVTEYSPIRQIARIKTIGGQSTKVPKRTGQPSANWRHETGTRTESTGLTYGLETVTPHELYALIKVTLEDLEDSAFNLEQEIIEEGRLAFAVAEGDAFIQGDAVGKPEGILSNSDITDNHVDNGHATTLSADAIIDLVHEPSSQYMRNARMLMNRSTIKTVRKLKDNYDQYLWQPSYQMGDPAQLAGVPVLEDPDMPDIESAAYPIAVGDFRQGYWIIDRKQITVQRLVEKYVEEGAIGFNMVKRVDGQVVLPEAIKVLKMETT
jgi:HK97 family phage major capsid protein